jgi:hypothetical protein
MEKQALRQFLRKQSRAQIPVTLYDIKLSEYVSAWKERDGFVKPLILNFLVKIKIIYY